MQAILVVTNIYGAVTSSVATLSVDISPSIITQPADVTVDVTSNATFTVTPSTAFTTPLSYQWLWNGSPIHGGTNSSLTITDVQATNVGYYSVIISNVAGSITSSDAWLIVQIFDPSFTNNTAVQLNDGYGAGCPNFTNTSDGRVLEMTEAAPGGYSTTAFLVAPIPITTNASFSTFFSFRLSGNPGTYTNNDNHDGYPWNSDGHAGGNGFVFMCQTLGNNAYLGGGGGGGLGCRTANGGTPAITNSLEVIFNTFHDVGYPNYGPDLSDSQTGALTTNANGTTGDGNHIGVAYNAWITNAATFRYGIVSNGYDAVDQHITDDLNNSNIWYAWVDYDGATSNLEIRLSETNSRPPSATLTNHVNLLDFLGSTNVYFGFTAGCGGAYNEQDILTWKFTSGYHPIGLANASSSLTVQFTNQLFIISPTNTYLTATVTDSSTNTITSVLFTNYTQSTSLGQGASTTNSVYQVAWEGVTNGAYNIGVIAQDSAGNVTNVTASITVNAMPSIKIILPTTTQSFWEVTNVPIQAQAFDSDGIVTNVSLYTNSVSTNNLLAYISNTFSGTNTYDFTWSNLPAGAYPIIAMATDDRGASAISEPVIIDVSTTNQPPSVEIQSPTNDAVFADGSDIVILATVITNSSAPVTNVEFYINGQDIGGDPNAPYEISECCMAPGTYELTAIATDRYGATAISSNVEITIAPPVPATQGYWDPQFFSPMWNYFTNVLGAPLQFLESEDQTEGPPPPPGAALSVSVVGSSQTVYIAAPYAVLSVSNGTNWSQLSFGVPVGGEPLLWPLEWDWMPYNAILADGTNVYVFGPTNATYEWDYSFPPQGYQLLEMSNNSEIRLGTFLNGDQLKQPFIDKIIKFDGNIYVSGTFMDGNPSADTNIAYVAKYDAQSNCWDAVGNGLNGPVVAMTVFGGSLIIGGAFTDAGGNTNINYIARLAGNVWTNVGAGVSIRPPAADEDTNLFTEIIPVDTFAICGSNLFAGGQFTTAGSDTNAHGIAVWDGSNWHSMNGGPGVNTYYITSTTIPDPNAPTNVFSFTKYWPPVTVTTISAHGHDVYVGGNFSYVANEETNDTITIDTINYSTTSEESVIVSNNDPAIVPASCIARATWNESDQMWHWGSLDGGVGATYDYTLPASYGSIAAPPLLAVESSLIVPGPNSNSYDLYIGSGFIGYDVQSTDYARFVLREFSYVGSEQIPAYGLARWRVGYPLPPGLPTVTITNPLNNAVLPNTNLITVGAAASSYTNIADVNFFDNGQLIASISSSPYSFSWIPPYGLSLLIAVATDGTGVQGSSKPVLINVQNPSGTISTTNGIYSLYVDSPPSTLNVLTNDSTTTSNQLRVVSAYIVQGNVGTVQVSYNGRAVVYTPNPDAFGTDIFVYSVTDGVSTNSAYCTVNVIGTPIVQFSQPDTNSPSEMLNSGGSIATNFTGTAFEYGGSITNVSLFVNGSLYAKTNTPNFNIAWSTTGTGIDTIVAVASDTNGLTNISSVVTIIPFASSNQVVGVISNLTDPTIVGDPLPVITSGLFDLQGAARLSSGSGAVAYQVILCTSDGYDTPIANITPQADAGGFHEGSDNNGDLGTLDLSTFQNGVYDLELSVVGGGSETNVTPVRFILNSTLKVGQFSFSEQDLNLPVHGIPITVTRTYNSQNPNSADFGYGWTFALNSLNVQLDEERQDVPSHEGALSSQDNLPTEVSVRSGGYWDVSLTLPDGQQTTFAFSLSGNDFQPTASWTAPAWVHAKLEAYQQPDVLNELYATFYPPAASFWEWSAEGLYAPFESQDLPGWVLTTLPDNTKYYITRGASHTYNCQDPNNPNGHSIYATVYGPPVLSEILEPSGDTIFINTNQIYHQDPSNNISAVVNITRDGLGRVTAISDPDGTNGLPLVRYVYDQDSGNLVQVLKLQDRGSGLYATNRYDYNNPNYPHLITSIENAEGAPVTRNYYDNSGRITQTVDANGNTNQFIYAATNMELTIDQLGRTNTLVYDSSGNIIAQTNALGQATLNGYDGFNEKTNQITFHNGQAYTNSYSYYSGGLGLLQSSTDPLGNTNGFTYNNLGETLSSSDARGNTTSTFYDGDGNLTATIDALTNSTVNFYNDGLLVGSTDPIGTATTNYYDQNGNLTNTATLDVSGVILSSNSYTYDANLNRLTSTVWRHVGGSWVGATTTNVYDAQNRVIETVNPDGGINTIFYNLLGQQAKTIDALGHTNSFIYDPLGRLVETMYPDGTTSSSAYDAAGNRTNSLDQLQRPTTYFFDALNRITNTIYADNATNATIYDDLGRVFESIDARGTIVANAYDAAGRRTNVINAFGLNSVAQTNSYAYDANGNQITFTDANYHTTTNVYDVLNRQVQVQYPDGTTTETVYDRDGRSIIQTNQDSITSEFGYDGLGRLISVTNSLGQVTRYQYDEAGNEVKQIDALLRTNFYVYDGQGRRTSHMMPGGQSESFAYDLDGNQTNVINFNGASITNYYDLMNRLASVSSYGYNVTYQFSATGQRTNMVDASGTNNYTFDNRDRLLQKTVHWIGGLSLSLNYLHDANGNLTNLWETPSNGVSDVYQYDQLNRLTNVLANGNAAATYAYDSVGNLQSLRYGNGVTNQYQYDSLNRLTNLVWKLNVGTLASFSYQLGATGNRISLNETNGGTNTVYAWQYDSLYRLTSETFNASSNLTYGYDAVGNRTTRTSGIGALTNQTFAFNTNDWLTRDTYDNNGNTVTSAGTNYQYDVMNHVTNAIINSSAIVMTYDGDGLRESKKAGSATTYYLVDDQNPSGYAQVLEEWTNNGTIGLSKVYNYGLDLISQRQPNVSTNYFVFDGHGSTRLLTDIGGTVVNVFVYDAFGNLIALNGVLQTGYLYCGQQYDSDLGVYYNRARYLNAGIGRFWTADSSDGNQQDPLSLHKYLYAADDPVNLDDPSGNDYGDFDISLSALLAPIMPSLYKQTDNQTLSMLSAFGAFASTEFVDVYTWRMPLLGIIKNKRAGHVMMTAHNDTKDFPLLSQWPSSQQNTGLPNNENGAYGWLPNSKTKGYNSLWDFDHTKQIEGVPSHIFEVAIPGPEVSAFNQAILNERNKKYWATFPNCYALF
jgi:RHS repeat-associated protein